MAGVVLKGFGALEKRIAKLDVKLQKEVDIEMSGTAREIANAAILAAPKFDGRLKGAITADVTKPFNKRIVANNVFYAPYMEFGTKGKFNAPPGLQAYAATFRNRKRGDATFDKFVLSLMNWISKNGYQKPVKAGSKRIGGTEALRAQAKWMAIRILKYGLRPRPFFFTQTTARLEEQLIKNVLNIIKP